jgi:hypothetical protein
MVIDEADLLAADRLARAVQKGVNIGLAETAAGPHRRPRGRPRPGRVDAISVRLAQHDRDTLIRTSESSRSHSA